MQEYELGESRNIKQKNGRKQLEEQKRQKTEAKQIPPKIVPLDCFCLLCCPKDFFWSHYFFYLFLFVVKSDFLECSFYLFLFFACILFQETDLYNVAGSC